MCLILMAVASHPRYPLVVAANRDEVYARPTAQAAFWDDAPHVLAGRDLRDGGTWLGITRTGRFAAVTNFRGPDAAPDEPVSRGALVRDYLTGQQDAAAYLAQIAARRERYRGFNLLVGHGTALYYYANRGDVLPQRLPEGVHALSNHLLNTPWPKVARAKTRLVDLLAAERIDADAVLDLLRDDTRAADEELPDTGVGLEREQQLSPIFIRTEEYGTRSSTLLTVDADGEVDFTERTFVDARPAGQRHFQFSLHEVPA